MKNLKQLVNESIYYKHKFDIGVWSKVLKEYCKTGKGLCGLEGYSEQVGEDGFYDWTDNFDEVFDDYEYKVMEDIYMWYNSNFKSKMMRYSEIRNTFKKHRIDNQCWFIKEKNMVRFASPIKKLSGEDKERASLLSSFYDQHREFIEMFL